MNIQGTATKLLAGMVTQLTAQGISLPLTQMVTPGLPAWDQNQVTVNFVSLTAGTPGSQLAYQYPLGSVFYGTFRFELVRSAPAMNSDGTMNATLVSNAAAIASADIAAIITAVHTCMVDGSVVSRGVPYDLVTVAFGPAGEPMGDKIGIYAILEIALVDA